MGVMGVHGEGRLAQAGNMKTLTSLITDFQDAILGMCMQGIGACHTTACVVMGSVCSLIGLIIIRILGKRSENKNK